YGLAPGLALLAGLVVYLFIHYNSFYVGIVTPEHVGFQEDEIAIFRDNPFHEVVVTTGYWLSEARDDNMRRVFKNNFKLGFMKDKDWEVLVNKFEKVKAGKILYRLGNVQVALDTLVDALKDSESDVRAQAAAALVKLGQTDPAVIKALVDGLKDQSSRVRAQAAAALGDIKSTDPAVIKALVDGLKDSEYDVRAQAAAALGHLLKPEEENKLLQRLASNFSGERTAGAQALARKDSLPPALLKKVDQLRKDDRPWVCLAAWDAHELIQARLESEAEAQKLLHQADSAFASSQYS
ncbi:MAG: HEAT repeat domain-containing protein, partial [candidate division KSB1 bacterium]|nr:HEAT repeat domain-containing protein [candidate division KSB1 bacterium]